MQSGSPVENLDNTATFRRSVITSVSPVSGERIADLGHSHPLIELEEMRTKFDVAPQAIALESRVI